MDWKKIYIYIGVFFLATFILGYIFGFIKGFLRLTDINAIGPAELNTLGLIYLIQGLVIFLITICIFAHLAIKLNQKVFVHAVIVSVGTCILSFPLSVLIMKQSIVQYSQGIIPTIFIPLIGVSIGMIIKKKKHPRASTP